MPRKKKEKFVDDGRTIANMNVEGMPWYNPARDSQSINGTKQTITASEKDVAIQRGELTTSGKNAEIQQEELTASGKFAMMSGILGAAMLISLIFIGVFLLFILFCSKVWLH